MIQIFEAIGIALASIWANKLRSFMMVLGNIVAVMSNELKRNAAGDHEKLASEIHKLIVGGG